MLGLGQFGNGMHRGNFHLDRDGRSPRIQGTPEDVRETQHIVDLVGVVAAARGNDGIAADSLHVFGADFRVGVGQGQNHRVGGHAGDHLFFEHAPGRQAQKHVGAFNHLGQRAGRGFLGELDLVVVHQFGAAFVNHTRQIGDENVFARHANFYQQAQASQRGCASTRGDQLDGFDVFAGNLEAIENCCAHHDGGAMLVVMKNRNLHAFAQFALDIKTIWCLDVFQVDAAKSGLERGDDVDQFVQVIAFVDFQVKHVDAGELLEQDAFALHHRFCGQWANVAEPQNGGAVGDHCHQITPRGVLVGVVGVFDDFFTRCRHARRIRQCQIMLVDQLFGGGD